MPCASATTRPRCGRGRCSRARWSTGSSRMRSRSTWAPAATGRRGGWARRGRAPWIGAAMQHVEEAGVHSGDSACVIPTLSLGAELEDEIRAQTRSIAEALGVRGLINVQCAVQGSDVYVIEANPRASRTVPFVAKATGLGLVRAACHAALGLPVALEERQTEHVSVKAAVLPFQRFSGAGPALGPEMRSTGEVMGIGPDFPTAFAKAERAAGRPLPAGGRVFLSVRDVDKP